MKLPILFVKYLDFDTRTEDGIAESRAWHDKNWKPFRKSHVRVQKGNGEWLIAKPIFLFASRIVHVVQAIGRAPSNCYELLFSENEKYSYDLGYATAMRELIKNPRMLDLLTDDEKNQIATLPTRGETDQFGTFGGIEAHW